MHTTFVRGVVDRAYFGLGPLEEVPSSVLLTESAADLAFSSLARYAWIDAAEGVGIYKLFSRYIASERLGWVGLPWATCM